MLIRKVVKVNRNIKDLRDILLKVLKIGGEKVVESEYLSVKEFAERAGVTVQSVYQRLNKSLKPYLKVENGVKSIDIKALKDLYGKDLEQGFKGDFKDVEQGFKGSEQKENNTSEQVIDLLREELKKKDEQIAKLMQLVDQEQRLLAAEQQKYLKVKEELEDQQKKKPWWQFWK